jgi:hypothetical protein
MAGLAAAQSGALAPSQSSLPAPLANRASLDNSRYYQNCSGQAVHSPAHSLDASVPAGATENALIMLSVLASIGREPARITAV